MRQWWQIWPRGLDQDFCQAILSHGLELPGQPAMVGSGKRAKVNASYCSATVYKLSNDREEEPWRSLGAQIDSFFREANLDSFGFALDYCREIQITEYTVRGHYDWHADTQWITRRPSHRKLSLVAQLNAPEEYDGGGLELWERPPDIERLKQQGTVIVFPSFLNQRFLPVTRGTCYTLSAWCEGPQFR